VAGDAGVLLVLGAEAAFIRMTADPFVPPPTATTVPPLWAVTPLRRATPFGVAMTLQLVPSQCSVNAPAALPTAQMSLAEMAAIPVR
jgi:hypothetical protein